MQPAPTGWYHAEGDAEGTVRYWDGTQWVGGPVSSPSGSAPAAGGAAPVPGAASPYSAPPSVSWQAATSYLTPFIERCYPADQLVTCSRWRRFFAAILDLGLLLGTLVLGWYIWFIFTAQDGQTPAKKILGMYVIKADGSRAGGGYMALRELVFRGIVGGVAGSICFVYSFLAPMWCLWDKDRQCLWDKMGSTYVARSPFGFNPLTAGELRMAGQPLPAFAPRA